MKTPLFIPLLKSTADADGTITLGNALSVRLSRFVGNIVLGFVVTGGADSDMAPFDVTVQPRGGPGPIPAPAGPESWANVGRSHRIQGVLEDTGIGGGAVEVGVHEFGGHRYGGFAATGTIPANAEIMLYAICTGEAKADRAGQGAFEYPAGSVFTPRVPD